MSNLKADQNNKIYLSIANGKLVQKVPAGTPGAVERKWEVGGKSGTKYELVFDNISGKITGVSFYNGEKDGRKFQNLIVEFDEFDGKTPVLSINSKTKYAEDIMKKLPNVDLSQEVKVRPFSFTPEGEDRAVTGVDLRQGNEWGTSVKDYYYDKEKKQTLHGAPEPTKEEKEEGDWETYYRRRNKFFIKATTERFQIVEQTSYPTKDINPEDIPF